MVNKQFSISDYTHYVAVLDVGSQSIKLGLRLENRAGGGAVSEAPPPQYLVAAVPSQGCIRDGGIFNVGILEEQIRRLFEQMNDFCSFRVSHVVLSLFGSDISSRIESFETNCTSLYEDSKLTRVTERDLNSLNKSINESEPLKVESGRMDWEPLVYNTFSGRWGEREVSAERVIGTVAEKCTCYFNIYTCSKDDFSALSSALSKVGVQVDRSYCSLRGAVSSILDCGKNCGDLSNCALVLNMGARIMEVGYISKGKLLRYERLNRGGDMLTQRLSEALGISFDRAEDLKREVVSLKDQARELILYAYDGQPFTRDRLETWLSRFDEEGKRRREDESSNGASSGLGRSEELKDSFAVKGLLIRFLFEEVYSPLIQLLEDWKSAEATLVASRAVEEGETLSMLPVHEIFITGGGLQFRSCTAILATFFNKYVVDATKTSGLYPNVKVYPVKLDLDYELIDTGSSEESGISSDQTLIMSRGQLVNVYGLWRLAETDEKYKPHLIGSSSVADPGESVRAGEVEEGGEEQEQPVEVKRRSLLGKFADYCSKKVEPLARAMDPSRDDLDRW